jgi:hypothetical protein
VFDPPSTPAEAVEAIRAHLVALALEHGVHEILTLDGDFARFPQGCQPESHSGLTRSRAPRLDSPWTLP